jgi:hypothetical protein
LSKVLILHPVRNKEASLHVVITTVSYHLRIQDLSKSQRIRHQSLIPIEGSDGD